AEPCGRNGEDVGVEAVRMDDLDPVRARVTRESEPFAQRPVIVESLDVILDDPWGRERQLLQELAAPPEARQMQLEARAIQPLGQRDDLALRPSDGKHGDELEEPDFLDLGEATPARVREGVDSGALCVHHLRPAGDGSAAVDSALRWARKVSRIASARPAM